MPISVVIVDDHPLVIAGLKSMFSGTDFRVVGSGNCSRDALELTKKHEPDVVLLDVRLPGEDGIAALTRIKLDYPRQPVVMYSASRHPGNIARALAIGANGFVSKASPTKELFDALAIAAKGENAWDRKQLRGIAAALIGYTTFDSTRKQDVDAPLTRRQIEALREVAKGRTNEQIAESLGISYESVRERIELVFRKIGVSDRTQAAIWAVRSGIA